MPSTRQHLRRGPIRLRIAGAVGERRGGHQESLRRLRDRLDEGTRGIDPVPVHADVDLVAVDAVDREPVD